MNFKLVISHLNQPYSVDTVLNANLYRNVNSEIITVNILEMQHDYQAKMLIPNSQRYP